MIECLWCLCVVQKEEAEKKAKEEAEKREKERQEQLKKDEEERLERKKVGAATMCCL